jgi:hypothetical protein
LDPDDIRTVDSKTDPIASIERALADGQHVEEQRLDELMSLWKVPKQALADDKARAHLASEIDKLRQEFLGRKGSLSPSDLPIQDKIELATQCATIISQASRFDIPVKLIQAYAEQASLFLGIKEAYIYRDWQSALGDMMILEVSGGPRRFDVIGYGAFEDRFLNTPLQEHDSSERRWFDRLQALFHDLDMGKEGIFDARRQQLKNLHAGCIAFERYLQTKALDLKEPSEV